MKRLLLSALPLALTLASLAATRPAHADSAVASASPNPVTRPSAFYIVSEIVNFSYPRQILNSATLKVTNPDGTVQQQELSSINSLSHPTQVDVYLSAPLSLPAGFYSYYFVNHFGPFSGGPVGPPPPPAPDLPSNTVSVLVL